ncbi:MAG: hypothetical protein HRT47_10010 [Candidatus Caenarcaniphilales bacterium]|nr:hypothetical protein [Candidatus Caenarcaniphilales bacterium]
MHFGLERIGLAIMAITPTSSNGNPLSKIIGQIGRLLANEKSETHQSLIKELGADRGNAAGMLQKVEVKLSKEEQKQAVAAFQAAYRDILYGAPKSRQSSPLSLPGTREGEIEKQYALVQNILNIAPLVKQHDYIKANDKIKDEGAFHIREFPFNINHPAIAKSLFIKFHDSKDNEPEKISVSLKTVGNLNNPQFYEKGFDMEVENTEGEAKKYFDLLKNSFNFSKETSYYPGI